MELFCLNSERPEEKDSSYRSFSWVCPFTLCCYIFLMKFTGYFNPLLAYGEEKAIRDARRSGANGFIIVDLPPEEIIAFQEKCAKAE